MTDGSPDAADASRTQSHDTPRNDSVPAAAGRQRIVAALDDDTRRLVRLSAVVCSADEGALRAELQQATLVADPRAVEDVGLLVEAAGAMGARLLLRQVRTGDGTPRHDPLRLAAAFRDVFDDFLGDVGTPSR